MKRLLITGLWIVFCIGLSWTGMAQSQTPPSTTPPTGNKGECHRLRKEMQTKLKDIDEKAREQRKETEQAFKTSRAPCWKNNRGDVDALKTCIANNQKTFDAYMEKAKSIGDQRFQDVLSTLDSYGAQLKACKQQQAQNNQSK